MRLIGASAGVLLAVALLAGQGVQYNPSALSFEHTDYSITTHYRTHIFLDGADYTGEPRYVYDVPQSAVSPDGNRYTLPFTAIPAAPVGYSYRALLKALNGDGVSAPSNITPEVFRFHQCVRELGTGITPPILSVITPPPSVVGRSSVWDVAFITPAATSFLVLDLIGDGAPAWYYVLRRPVSTPSAKVFVGPFTKQGRYEITGRLIDEQGCEATLSSGQFITVS